MGERPIRVQRQRTKGWRMPPNTVYVGRPGRFGNPFSVRECAAELGLTTNAARRMVCDWFGDWINRPNDDEALGELGSYCLTRDVHRAIHECLPSLRGKNLACWCRIISHGQYVPCHADVLLSIANNTPMDEVIRENIRRAEGEAL